MSAKNEREQTQKRRADGTSENRQSNHPYGNKPTLSPIKQRSLRARCDTLSMNSLFNFQR